MQITKKPNFNNSVFVLWIFSARWINTKPIWQPWWSHTLPPSVCLRRRSETYVSSFTRTEARCTWMVPTWTPRWGRGNGVDAAAKNEKQEVICGRLGERFIGVLLSCKTFGLYDHTGDGLFTKITSANQWQTCRPSSHRLLWLVKQSHWTPK